jgi:ABC-type Fe3+-hydroxamate transport system substrate-binding protein
MVPSITEAVADLGCEKSLIAVTRFCEYPRGLKKQKIIIGGTKNPKLPKIITADPDLILANKEENRPEDVLALRNFFPVYVSDVKTMEDCYGLLNDLGLLLNCRATTNRVIEQIVQKRQELKKDTGINPKKVVYLIWKEPLMTIGGDTYIHHLLEQCGLHNVFGDQKRYPIITQDAIRAQQPDYIFLSSEPYPFSIREQKAFKSEYPGNKIIMVDGRMFSWYGTSTLRAMSYLKHLRRKLK